MYRLSSDPILLELQVQGRSNLQLSERLQEISLPALSGRPILVATRPRLATRRGKLVSDYSLGPAVYAAAFLRERKILLEAALLSDSKAFRLILIHELFHFVWPRLGNNVRREFTGLLSNEWTKGARGELGESSAVKRDALQLSNDRDNAAKWRDYVCESFCDTAAWLYAEVEDSVNFTLRKRWRGLRKEWFEATASRGLWKC